MQHLIPFLHGGGAAGIPISVARHLHGGDTETTDGDDGREEMHGIEREIHMKNPLYGDSASPQRERLFRFSQLYAAASAEVRRRRTMS